MVLECCFKKCLRYYFGITCFLEFVDVPCFALMRTVVADFVKGGALPPAPCPPYSACAYTMNNPGLTRLLVHYNIPYFLLKIFVIPFSRQPQKVALFQLENFRYSFPTLSDYSSSGPDPAKGPVIIYVGEWRGGGVGGYHGVDQAYFFLEKRVGPKENFMMIGGGSLDMFQTNLYFLNLNT